MPIPDVNQLTAKLRGMRDDQLQSYAQMHKEDPYVVSLVMSEVAARKSMRAQQQALAAQVPPDTVVDQNLMQMSPQAQPAPQMQGLSALPAGNIANMADGGIAGYDDEDDEIERFSNGGGPRRQNVLGQYESLIRSEAQRQGVDPDLMMRLFTAESSGDPEAVSNKGAMGLGQLMPATAKDMGLSAEERRDPVKNIVASIGYFAKQQAKYGDPAKAAAAYNWGPANLDKHIAKSKTDWKLGLPKETADYLTKLVPVSTATAAAPTAPAPAGQSYAAIPGEQTGRPEYKPPSFGEKLVGTGETALSLLSAIPGGLAGGAEYVLRGGKGDPGKYIYSPRTEAGQDILGEVTETLGRLPPTTGVSIPSRAVQAARASKEAEAAAARAVPRLAGPANVLGPRTGMSQGELRRMDERAMAAYARDQKIAAETAEKAAKAQAVADRAADTAKYAKEVEGRAGLAGLAANQAEQAQAAQPSPVAAPSATLPNRPVSAADNQKFLEANAEPSKADIKDIKDNAPADVKKQAKKEGWTNDDWLTFGFALLANKSPYFSEAIGTAGLAALSGQKERRKLEKEEEKEASEALYRERMGRKAEAEAAYVSGLRGPAQAYDMATKAMANWDKNVPQYKRMDPGFAAESEAQYRKFLFDAFTALQLPLPPELSSPSAGQGLAIPQGVKVYQTGG